MAKYMVQGNYLGRALNTLLSEGGSKRRAIVERLFASVGGALETWYYCFGEYDFVGIGEAPDNASMESIVLTVRSTGFFSVKVTPLMTPEEMDQLGKKTPTYTAPG